MSTARRRWFAAAIRHHYDAVAGAYNLIADDAPALIAKPLSIADEATPAATGTMAANAATLFTLTGNERYRDHAEEVLGHLSARIGTDLVGSASLQSAFDTLLRGRLAFVVGSGAEATALLDATLAEPDPALLIAQVDASAIPAGHPASGKRPAGSAGLFLCDASRCLPEIATAEDATEALRRTRSGLTESSHY